MSDLAGVTMIELAGMGPVARCARALGDLGARWVRVVAPPTAGRWQVPWHSYGAYRGAEHMTIDLKTPAGREAFLTIADRSDVVVEGMRPGAVERLGIGFDAVSARNPALVYCSITGYGQNGPYAGWAGHDLNYVAVAGALATGQRRADGGPPVPGVTVADSAGGGWQAAMRILAALVARSETGRGRYLDVAAAQGVLDLMAFTIDEYLSSGPDSEIASDLITGRYACYDLYQASDGGWIAVAAIEGKFFANLCAALGLDDWIERQYDAEAQGGLRSALAACFSERPRDDWIDALAPRDTCVAPVLGVDEIARDPHWAARGVIDTYVHPTRGLQRQVHCLGDNGRGEPPPLDDDSSASATLRRFGIADQEIERMLGSGAVG